MKTNRIEQVIREAVHEAMDHMSTAEVRKLVLDAYLEIREGSR